MGKFKWTADKLMAAALLAEGRLTIPQVAERMKVTSRAVDKWKAHPEFAAKIRAIMAEAEQAVTQYAVAQKAQRVARLNQDWLSLQDVQDARKAAMADQDADPLRLGQFRAAALAAGMTSGNVVVEWVTSPTGGFRPQFKVDTSLLREVRDIEKQVAAELANWEQTLNVKGPTDDVKKLSDAEIEERIAQLRSRTGGAGA